MRKVYCDMCGENKVYDPVFKLKDISFVGKSNDNCLKAEGETEKNKKVNLADRIFNYIIYEFDLCEACQDYIGDDITEIMEKFENDETEKCAHCGKSLAGMMISTEHITRAGKFCSQGCYYNAGIKPKKES